MKTVAAALLALLLGAVFCPTADPKVARAYAPGQDSSLYLDFGDAACTGTLIHRHGILTATHCIEGGRDLLRVNGVDVDARVVANDGNDHIIIRTRQPLNGRIAKIAGPPAVGEDIYLWGNPSPFRSLLRRGYLSGTWAIGGKDVYLYDINGWHGDSGGAMFNARGEVVAVLWGGLGQVRGALRFQLVATQPIAFTPGQIKVALQ